MVSQLVPSPITNTMPPLGEFYSAAALTRGQVCYVSGYNAASGLFAVTLADANVAGRPPQWIAQQNVAAGGTGIFSPLDQPIVGMLDTSMATVGDPVYLSATAGALTLTAPTGATAIYIVGYVTVVSATVGAFQLMPAGNVIAVQEIPAITGPLAITSNSTAALAVGPNGATNPVFQVDGNTASAATGIKITGAAAAAGVAVAVISSGTDESLTLNAKGAGTVSINATATGGITLGRATTITTGGLTVTAGGIVVTAGNLSLTGDGSGAVSLIVGTTNGLKIGSAASQKIGFFNATPVVQQTKAGHNNWAMTSDVVDALVSLGLFDQA